MNININDYKESSEKYSSIEIKIKPVKNKYGQFINIKKEEEDIIIYILTIIKKKLKQLQLTKNTKFQK